MDANKRFLAVVGVVGMFAFAFFAVVIFNCRPGKVAAIGGLAVASAICFLGLVLLTRK